MESAKRPEDQVENTRTKNQNYGNPKKLDDGWPESEKHVFQAALRMVVVKDSRWIVGQFYMSYGRIWREKGKIDQEENIW